MPQSVAFIGVKADKDQGVPKVQAAVRSLATLAEVKLDGSKFKLGSLDSMLLNLERAKKIEMVTENFLKRIEKVQADMYPDKKLTSYKLDSKDFGPIDIEKFLKKFDWDDIRYPRTAALSDQIRNIEEKVASMEKNLKVKQQNFSDSKAVIANTVERKDNVTSFINRDLNDTIMEMLREKRSKNLRPEIFVNSEYLQSCIVFIPKEALESFSETYELQNEFIVPKSFVELTENYGYIMGHVVVFKKSAEDVRISFKDKYKAITKDFAFNAESASNKEKEKSAVISQNKTDKDLLASTCVESFKESLVALIHIKMYVIVIDCSLRFGQFGNFKIVLVFFDKGKEGRLLQSMVKAFAEPDKTDFYGTKEQLNDTEDFFPFVYTNLGIAL